MDCFNNLCPFRVNETSSATRCECLACPNRDSHEYVITSNRTLTKDEIISIIHQNDPDYGRGNSA